MLDIETQSLDTENKMKKISDELQSRTSLLEGAVQGAYAAAQQATTSQTGGASGKVGRSLSQEKALESIGKIMGVESVSSLLEWKRKLMIIIDTVLPGAYTAFEAVENALFPSIMLSKTA